MTCTFYSLSNNPLITRGYPAFMDRMRPILEGALLKTIQIASSIPSSTHSDPTVAIRKIDYSQCEEEFPSSNPELAELLKDFLVSSEGVPFSQQEFEEMATLRQTLEHSLSSPTLQQTLDMTRAALERQSQEEGFLTLERACEKFFTKHPRFTHRIIVVTYAMRDRLDQILVEKFEEIIRPPCHCDLELRLQSDDGGDEESLASECEENPIS